MQDLNFLESTQSKNVPNDLLKRKIQTFIRYILFRFSKNETRKQSDRPTIVNLALGVMFIYIFEQ